jgi:hypothetical protein
VAAVSARADALADLIAAAEAPNASPQRAVKLEVGSLVLQKRRGVTVALATAGNQVVVGGFGQPLKPYVRVALSFVTPLVMPADVGRVLVRTPSDFKA